MKKLLKKLDKEWDLKVCAVIVFSLIFLVLNKYHSFFWESYLLDSLIFYLGLPLLVIILVFRDKVKDYGIRVGDWKFSLKWIGIFAAIMVGATLISLLFPSIVGYYGKGYNLEAYLARLLRYGIYLIGWEFLFRGFMLFGLEKKFGKSAIFIALIPFVLLHLGKPEIETLGTILSGVVLGWVALRSRNFWSAWLLHFLTGVLMYGFANFLV